MKKLLSISLLLVLLLNTISIKSEEKTNFSIAEKIKSFMLVNYPISLEGIQKSSDEFAKSSVDSEIDFRRHQFYTFTEEQINRMYISFKESFGLVPEDAFYFHKMNTIRYSKQYADNFDFDLLINENNKIWVAPSKQINSSSFYNDSDFSRIEQRLEVIDKKVVEFIKQPEMIEEMVEEQIDEEIVDCKIIMLDTIFRHTYSDGTIQESISNVSTILYLKGQTNDYGIKLWTSSKRINDPAYLESFKVYKMSQLLNSFANYEIEPQMEINDQKPLYETEALSLQADGLLQGNEKGLDLLKPLNRIEATTILVRALGLENEPTDTASKFSDIPDNNWGVKYANIAYDAGITRGIGNNKFAPDDLITSTQFSTLLLRNFESKEFDWQTATDMLIEKDIITPDQSETMDLFTRGDMAKIIYEAKQKGLIN